ncbi:transporter substrate-binding domain-containing protein [Allohahella marinimesophila]|uniref:Transporter substrate-binding domain-containing protein n=1 Tax=Allohahella marinimesophila TaxID=1054972 RepID=A0ABP7PMZ4_9GAMM
MANIRSSVHTLFFPVLLLLIACDMPQDPEDTFERATDGPVRVGLTGHSPWVIIEDGQYSGTEVQLVQAFSDKIGSRIEWHEGSESVLLESLKRHELDLVIGGLKKSIPWKTVAFTKPYMTIGQDKHVMAVPLGENRWLLELEKFLNSPPAKEIMER